MQERLTGLLSTELNEKKRLGPRKRLWRAYDHWPRILHASSQTVENRIVRLMWRSFSI